MTTKREYERQMRQAETLRQLGFTQDEAQQLRRISMTLQRWFEQECGNSNDYGSWAIERDENGEGPPFMVHHHYRHGNGTDSVTRTPIPDREAGARKRLAGIIRARNERTVQTKQADGTIARDIGRISVTSYIQGDPRGAALYILRPGDIPEGADAGAYYNRGICVY